jgi:SAM-dependent methyltransferase
MSGEEQLSADIPVAREAYDALAVAFSRHAEVSPYNAYYERPALQALLPAVSGQRVLDAGCSSGAHSQWLLEHGASVVALDVSQGMVELARQRLGARAEILQADLGAPLPRVQALQDGDFDVVVCSLTLHYVGDWTVPLAEFHRLLEPGGALVFSTHHPAWDRQLVDEDDYFQTGLVEDRWPLLKGPVLEVRFYRKTLAEILTSVARAGFVIEAVEEPLPTDELRDNYPEDFVDLRRQPAFLLIRARRP